MRQQESKEVLIDTAIKALRQSPYQESWQSTNKIPSITPLHNAYLQSLQQYPWLVEGWQELERPRVRVVRNAQRQWRVHDPLEPRFNQRIAMSSIIPASHYYKTGI